MSTILAFTLRVAYIIVRCGGSGQLCRNDRACFDRSRRSCTLCVTLEYYYCLGDAIAVARGLHELLRSADLVHMAAWAQTVNVIGAIKTTRNHAVLDPVGHVLALYGTELGGTLVPLEVPDNATLDAVAAVDKKRGALTIGLISFSPSEAISLKLKLSERSAASTKAWRIQGAALGDINIPGEPEAVTTAPLEEAWLPTQPLVLPAHSITLVQFK